jgi:uncharacterized membrane protein
MAAVTAAPRLYLDAELRPRRSLSRRGVALLMLPLVAINLIFATFFFVLGAAFVPPFLGLDVLAMGIALLVSFRSARRIERVRVTADEIRVTHERGRWMRIVWASPTAFTRVDLEQAGRHGAALRLSSKGEKVTVAAALSPPERESFAHELEAALAAARAERW